MGSWQVHDIVHTGVGESDAIDALDIDVNPTWSDTTTILYGKFTVLGIGLGDVTVRLQFATDNPPINQTDNSPFNWVLTEGDPVDEQDTITINIGDNYTFTIYWSYSDHIADWGAGDTWTFQYSYVPVSYYVGHLVPIFKHRML